MIGSVLVPVAVILGLAVVAAGVVYFGFRLRSGEPINLSLGLLLRGYFYLLTIAGLILFLIGLSGLINAGLGVALGRDFSYARPPVAKAVPPPPEGMPRGPVPSLEEQQGQANRQQEREFREGLFQGASRTLVGGLVWLLHTLGRRRMEQGEGRASSVLEMGYLAILLAISSLVGLISLASGVFDTLRFYLVDVEEFGFRAPPGQSISVALAFIPVWVYYLLALLGRVKQTQESVNT